jgi:hypothetical protein
VFGLLAPRVTLTTRMVITLVSYLKGSPRSITPRGLWREPERGQTGQPY